jgi:hypothetical protein
MIEAHAPEYDYKDRLRSLLEYLEEHGATISGHPHQ